MLFSGLVIAAPASKSGKTSAAIGLITALRKMGHSVLPAKLGPDYLDAQWLAKAADRPCINLDTWMSAAPPQKMLARFAKPGDVAVIESAMGLFDGASDGKGSAAEIAGALQLPILLLLPAASMGQSIGAVAHGFLSYTPAQSGAAPTFCGIICTQVGTMRHRQILQTALNPICAQYQVPLLGYLPKEGHMPIPSRYLGLVQSTEQRLDFEKVGQWFCDNVPLLPVLRPSLNLSPRNYREPEADVLIAIARDEAFTFCYADLPEMLQEMGAEIVYFSPLADHKLPLCNAIYFPGGYPELYAANLSANNSLIAELRYRAAAGMPIYGECGGYMYLMQSIKDQTGAIHQMVGLLSGGTAPAGRTLGYREVKNGLTARGHEFHYFDYDRKPTGIPMWEQWNSSGKYLGQTGEIKGNVQGSWIHLYPEGSRGFWQGWIEKARKYPGTG